MIIVEFSGHRITKSTYYRYLPTWVNIKHGHRRKKKITKISRWEIYSSRLDKKNETKKTISHLALEKQGPNYLFSPLSKTGTRQAISCLVSEKNRDQTGYFLSSLRKNNEIRQAISCLVLKKKPRLGRLFLVLCWKKTETRQATYCPVLRKKKTETRQASCLISKNLSRISRKLMDLFSTICLILLWRFFPSIQVNTVPVRCRKVKKSVFYSHH